MIDHTNLLNYIAAKIGAKVYVEIGVFNPDHNFNKINVKYKIGVDPDSKANSDLRWSSDAFFEFAITSGIRHVDLTWVDGLHYEEQVAKDIMNALAVTRPGGVIAIHDCNPPTEKTTCRPRGSQREWCGDVYKAISRITWPADFFTIDFDYGCCIIRKNPVDSPLLMLKADITDEEAKAIEKKILEAYPKYGPVIISKYKSATEFEGGQGINFNDTNISWEDFDSNREELIHLVSLEEGLARIGAWT